MYCITWTEAFKAKKGRHSVHGDVTHDDLSSRWQTPHAMPIKTFTVQVNYIVWLHNSIYGMSMDTTLWECP